MSFAVERHATFTAALALMESEAPFVFITGRAGTGKSTLLRTFRLESSLVCPVLAPTGVAALNVGGETIHRFFRFAPGITVKDARKKGMARRGDPMLRAIDAFIIDEISMVRADLLDCMDACLQAALDNPAPFGGKRIITIGDLAQLPPVIKREEREDFAKAYESPYFFSSHAIQILLATNNFQFLELDTVYRQTDPEFIRLLQTIRDRSANQTDIAKLNSRHIQKVPSTQEEHVIILTTTNDQADSINEQHLDTLKGKTHTYTAQTKGDFKDKDAPTDEVLSLKIGARVMCIANDSAGQYVNGSIGTIQELYETSVLIQLDEGREVLLEAFTWTLFESRFDDETQTLNQEKRGSFSQIPLRLAWAITIHKSQGKTFDKLVLDLERGTFAHGQLYVALSRCRSLEGITLRYPIQSHHLHKDDAVQFFIQCLRDGTPIPIKGQGALL